MRVTNKLIARLCLCTLSLYFVYLFLYKNYRNTAAWKLKASESVLWAVLAKENDFALDILLESLRGEKVIVFLEAKSAAMEYILRKHGAEFKISSKPCYTPNSASETCLNTSWMKLLQHAWKRQPDIVCFTTEEVAINEYAKIFIQENCRKGLSGVQLSSNTSSPWCFERHFWESFKKDIEASCALAAFRWEKSISNVAVLFRNKIVLAPSIDLSTGIKTRVGLSDSTFTSVSREIKAFQTINRSLLEETLQIRPQNILADTLSPILATWQNFTPCSEYICENFEFKQLGSDGLFVNQLKKGGFKAFLIDLGPTCVDTSKIEVSKGGEKVEDVLGRKESVEFPKYEYGAFRSFKKPNGSESTYQQDVVMSIKVVNRTSIKYDTPGTTLAYTRYDYANICFVINDLFNIYLSLKYFPSNNLLLLDGHASSNVDDVVSDLFDMNFKRIGHLDGTICFERLVLVPRRYFLYDMKKFRTCDILDFIQTMWRKFDIVPAAEKHDTVILRDYYLAHPRVTGMVSRKFSDSELQNIKKALPDAKLVRFHELSWKDQLQIIANTKTLYGMHGAGLTLGLFLTAGSKMVEWTHPSRLSSTTYPNYMTWRPDVTFERMSLSDWLNTMGFR